MKVLSCLLVSAAILVGQNVMYSYDQAGRLSTASYPDGKVMTWTYDASGNLLRRVVAQKASGPAPSSSSAGVLNAASYKGAGVSPGEIVAVFGNGIGPAQVALQQITAAGHFDTYVGETTVPFDGIPAPVIYASGGQSAVVVPYSVAGQASTQMVVTVKGLASAPVTVPVVAAAPGLFSANASGTGNGAIVNQDGTLNSPANPASAGSVIVLFGTGEGQTSPKGVDGRIAATVFPKPVAPVKVTIGGLDATVLYAGAAPSLVAGVFQINATLPAGVTGNVPVVVSFGSASTQAGLTVAVK